MAAVHYFAMWGSGGTTMRGSQQEIPGQWTPGPVSAPASRFQHGHTHVEHLPQAGDWMQHGHI